MYLKLQRQSPEGEWLRGTLYCLTSNSPKGDLTSNSAAVFTCDTLERTSKAVLPLIYSVSVTQSPKFKRLLPILCNVPNNLPSLPSKEETKESSSHVGGNSDGFLQPATCNLPPVSGSRLGIRIHVGTKPEHSLGCILVPNRQIEDQITQLLLQAQQQHEDIRLDISNFRPDYTDIPCPMHECAVRNFALDRM